MQQRAFELFYEKFVAGQISAVQKLERSDRGDPRLKILRQDTRRFTKDLPAQRSRLGRFRRAPLEEVT